MEDLALEAGDPGAKGGWPPDSLFPHSFLLSSPLLCGLWLIFIVITMLILEGLSISSGPRQKQALALALLNKA